MRPRPLFLRTVAAFVTLLISLPATSSPTSAQGTPMPVEGFDLAAMALAPDDLPPGFFDDYGEWWVPAAAASAFLFGGEPAPEGLVQAYQTFYVNDEQAMTAHIYLFQYSSAEQTDAGMDAIDAILRPPLPEGTIEGPSHEPGPALGDGESFTTRVTYDTRTAGGPLVDVVATTFRRDRIVAGVSVELTADPAEAATPASIDGTSASAELSESLASTLDERIALVLAGGAPAGIDLALPGMVLPIGQLAESPRPLFEGYKTGLDLLRCGICGEENSLAPFADDALGGFNRSMVAGPDVDGEPQPPIISVTMIAFASPEAATETLDAMRHAPNDRPTPYPVPRGLRTPVEDPAIPGTVDAAAFEGILEDDPAAPVDSASIVFVFDTWLVAIDVQGGLSADAALAVATDLATQQAECLVGGACNTVETPAALEGASG